MATLILFRVPEFDGPQDGSTVVEAVERLDACIALLCRAPSPCVVVIGPGVAATERSDAVQAAVDHGAYYLLMQSDDSSARVRRLIRVALRVK